MNRLRYAFFGVLIAWACGGTATTSGSSSSSSAATTASNTASTTTTTAATTGSGGSPQTTGTGGQGQGGMTTTTGPGGSGAGGAGCSMPCGGGLNCCAGKCVNYNNDILNCGKCGNKCEVGLPYCDKGKCSKPPCGGIACIGTKFCCGNECCDIGKLCCTVPGPIEMGPKCYTPTAEGSCPAGCPDCK